VVSPLTTLLANDLTEAEVLSFFQDAGLTGLSTADLYADPMKGLNSLLAVNDDDLVNLQAAIAVNKFMLLLGDYDMPKEEILLHGEEMANMVQLVKQVVNSLILGATLEEISGPMANAQVTPTMGAPISAGANLIDTVVAGFMADPLQDPLVAAEEKLAYLSELALIYSVQANRGLQGVEDEITLGNLPEIDANFTPDITELQNALEGSKGPVTAEAGLNQNVTVGNEVFLSGSFIFNVNQAHSFINLGDSSNGISFFWAFESKPAASSAQLTDKRSQFPSFTADEAGTYVLRLTVFNQGVAGTTDTVTIYASRVENLPPVANSGTDQHITTGDTVMLNGSASFDNDGDLLSYFWAFESIPAGSGALLSDSSIVNPTFLADIDGTYIVSLTVNDGLVDSVPVSVIVTAASGNVAPVAAAGSNQNIPVGTTVTLNGSTSSDADNDSLIYSWSLTVKPAGSSAALSNISVVNPSFVADLAGIYQVQLVVNDGSVDSAPDSVSVTASSTNVPPVANGGTNQNVAVKQRCR
jgi:hypothetical protein